MDKEPTNSRDGATEIVHPESAHEKSDISVKAVAYGILALLVFLVAAIISQKIMFGKEAINHPWMDLVSSRRSTEQRVSEEFPKPLLQTDELEDLKRLRARENAVLETYDWVDPAKRIVRVPIATAMDLILQQGLPARKERP
jgi:hypothetical protein